MTPAASSRGTCGGGSATGSARFEVIAAVLADGAPDVVGLQEVWARGRSVNAAGLLARRLGLHWACVPSPAPERWQRKDRRLVGGVRQRGAVAVADRRGRARRPAGAVVRRARRAAGAARRRSTPRPGGCRSSRRSSARSRGGRGCGARRCGGSASFVASHSPDDGLPPVVTGDLNAVPESDEVRLLEGFLTEPAVPDLLLVDAWRYAAPGDRGITWSRANPHAAVTGEPDARIDYVLVGTPRGAGSALDDGGAGGGGPAAGRGVALGPRGGGGGPAARRAVTSGRGLRDGRPSRSAGSRRSRSAGRPGWPTAIRGADQARHWDGLSWREATSRSCRSQTITRPVSSAVARWAPSGDQPTEWTRAAWPVLLMTRGCRRRDPRAAGCGRRRCWRGGCRRGTRRRRKRRGVSDERGGRRPGAGFPQADSAVTASRWRGGCRRATRST